MEEGTVLTCCDHIMLHLVWTFNGFIFSSDFYCEGVECEATIVIFNLLWMLLIFSDLYCESVGFEATIVISDLLWMLLIFSDLYCESMGFEATIFISSLLWMLLIFSDLYCESVGFEATIVICTCYEHIYVGSSINRTTDRHIEEFWI